MSIDEQLAIHPSVSRVALVTGGNKGLGKETVRRLVSVGHTVYLGSRDAERGRLAAAETGARALVLDVTDETTIDRAVARIREDVGHLDLLVNNAGYVGDLAKPPADVGGDDMQAVYDTNVFGLVRMLRAFIPLLAAADSPSVVNVSSGMGSLSRVSSLGSIESFWPSPVYASSKSAVNMITVQYANAFPGIRINAVDPGLTATDGTGGVGKDVADGVTAIVTAALRFGNGPTGTFTDADGVVPW